MHWRARFKRWLDRWLAGARQATRDDGSESGAVPSPVADTTRRTHRKPEVRSEVRAIGLALQGGGAHGAFTWGVLDRLLEEDDLAFPAISGASAGALNGAMLVSGFAAGGRAGAQQALASLWDGVAGIGAMVAPLQTQQRLAADFGLVPAEMMQAMMRMWSPAQLNPFNLNPLRTLLDGLVDVEALRNSRAMRLYVAATSVETGQPRIFTGGELSIDVLLASACLPFLNHAVTIDGVAYWDGGYSANPPLAPLVDEAALDEAAGDDAHADVREILLVQINPEHRSVTPSTASDIMHRVNEITFNASLLAELRMIEAGQIRAARAGQAGAPSPLRMHRIALHDEVADAKASSAGSLDGAFHRTLRDHGRSAAERWLASP